MAKANIETKNGTKIIVEGTPEEISKIMTLYKGDYKPETEKELKKFVKRKSNAKPTVTDKMREMIAEGFFDKPKGLAELKNSLEEQGCFVPITTLSPIVLGLVKNKELRRIKQDKKWVYAKR
ncbi:MAG: hypothetical protein WC974_03145 [Thermoplasmata archaeon]